jgi:hypothetical protein
MTAQQSLITIAVRAAEADASHLEALKSRFGGAVSEAAGKRRRWETRFDLLVDSGSVASELTGAKGAREILTSIAGAELPRSAEVFCTVTVQPGEESEEELAAIDEIMLTLERMPAARFTLDCR